jgi:hypothetical protein
MSADRRRIYKIVTWVIVALAAAVVSVLFWAPVGVALLLAMAVIGIFAVLRDLVRELRGKRPPYTAGAVTMSDIPQKPKSFWFFWTRSSNETQDKD